MQSKLKFKNFVVPKFLFEKIEIENNEELFDIIPQAILSYKKKQFHINIDIEIIDIKNSFVIKMLAVGIFEFEKIEDNILKSFISVNGLAIIFPYIRAFISSYTALSGFDTITLPTLNLTSFKDSILEELIILEDEE
ncbi:protein-export chaperone SecB [Chryseobacterium indologenes]|uniref:protein-export chaperone SecB n=1 Tax=Chryseobacterium indologenes TaxID=253 RepID=UPI0023E89D1E|nr:protein-export chaperone SecB [Chryseobacterium indologenes]WET47710.1 protein-export chaperone SecB [Chryseobacterium indologenes]